MTFLAPCRIGNGLRMNTAVEAEEEELGVDQQRYIMWCKTCLLFYEKNMNSVLTGGEE